jgi:hypothetical protein
MTQHATISPLSITIVTTLFLIIITCKSHELIGFIYGPSSQIFATKQQIIQSNLLSRILTNSETISTTTTTSLSMTTWMTRIAATAEQIYNPHYELAYQLHDCNTTCILRDGGVIAALYVLLHACNFFGTTTPTKQQQPSPQRQRFHYLYLAGVLFILPGMIGQIVLSKTIPIEIVLLKRDVSSLRGIFERLLYVGYCSLKSVLDHHHGGGGDLVVGSMVYELKVVGVALAFVAFFLGES